MLKRQFLSAPMGWNSYDYYNTVVTESEVKANADYMAANLKEYGWEYIVVDADWYVDGGLENRGKFDYLPFTDFCMDEYSRVQPCLSRFPSSAGGKGFGPLAGYVHGKGLKFGIHMMRGVPRQAAHEHRAILCDGYTAADIANPYSPCKWNPDMYGVKATAAGQAYYDSLLAMYADWGVDFIKCDDICNTNMFVDNPYSAADEIEMLSHAIEKCGREITLSLSPGPAVVEKAWHYQKYANMWRITNDFWDEWRLLKDMFTRCAQWQDHVRMGSYPDCDMLPLGKVGKMFPMFGGQERTPRLTKIEQKTMMTLWCIFRSPLMLGAELTRLDPETLSLITNCEVLALVGENRMPRMIDLRDGLAIWASLNKTNGEITLALFNLADETQTITCELTDVANSLPQAAALPQSGSALELWTETEMPWQDNAVGVTLSAHDCTLIRMKH